MNADTESELRELLSNVNLGVFIKSATKDYSLEYYTDRSLGDDPDNPTLKRAYKLHDHVRGTEVKSPWDSFDLNKQMRILTVLL